MNYWRYFPKRFRLWRAQRVLDKDWERQQWKDAIDRQMAVTHNVYDLLVTEKRKRLKKEEEAS